MKAVYINEQGGLDTLIYGDLPEPEIGPGEVLVRVRACALNRVDVFTREGSHGVRRTGPSVLGLDFAGDVAALGGAVTQFQVGQRVMGVGTGGTYAEYARASADRVQPIPEGIPYEEAAGVPTVFCTVWRMLVRKAHIAPGEDVLVMAGGSGVGSAAIQVCKLHGARVFTTASTDDKLEKARGLGADVGINYRQEDFAKRVLELTGGEGVDIVFEHIGTPVWEQCFASLKRGGRLVTCGVTAGHMVQLHLGRLWTRDLSLLGSQMRPQEDLATVVKLLARRQIRGVIHAVYPLAEAARAHQMLEENSFFGKVVLSVP